MRDFKKYTIWQEGIDLVKKIYRFSESLPNNEKFGLTSQIRRAAVSIPSNIAEGCSRNSDIEFKRYLEIALGSAFELETQLIIIKSLIVDHDDNVKDLIDQLNNLQKSMNRLIQKIKQDKK